MIYTELQKVIDERGISVMRLALELMIPPNNLYAALKGDIPMYPRYRKSISEFFNKPEEELFPGIEEI